MIEPIKANFRFTVEELLTAQRWYLRYRTMLWQPLIWLVISMLLLGAVWQWSESKPIDRSFIYLPALFIVGRFVLLPWQFRRQFAKRPDRDSEMAWTISEQEMQLIFHQGKAEFSWSALTKVLQTPGGFLLFQTPEIFHWLPKHAFENDGDFARLSELSRRCAPKFEEFPRNTQPPGKA